MLAYVYDRNGKLSLREKPNPEPRDDNAIVKVNACSICGTDIRIYLNGSNRITPPRTIGHEVCGTLITVGKKITGFSVGERVILTPAIGCGRCCSCFKGYANLCENLKTIGFQYDGGFAEYMEIPLIFFGKGNVNKIEDHVVDEEVVLTEPISCVVNAQEFLKIKKGECVAIFGSGFIGCMHAEIAFISGADQVIMIEINRKRAEQAKQLIPGIKIINPIQIDLVKEVNNLTIGKGADVAIIACSSGRAQMDALNITAKRGRVSLFGGLTGESKGFLDSNLIHYKELSIYGAHASTAVQNRLVLGWITKEKLRIKKYISKIFDLRNIEEVFKSIHNENIMKAVIKPK